MYMEAVWKDIYGYESLYQVSNLGEVRSVDHEIRTINQWGTPYVKVWRGRVLKPGFSDGYAYVILSKDGVATFKDIHRLVATMFVDNPNRDLYTEVNHKDRNKSNNVYSNLEWVTHAQNVEHAKLTGMHSAEGLARIRAGTANRKTLRAVICVEANRRFSSIAEAGRSDLPISHSGVELSLYKHKSVNGLTFIYAEEVDKCD